MKLSFENFEKSQQQQVAIPLTPIAKWNVRDSDLDEYFHSMKLELKTNPSSTDSVKFSSYFKVFENGTPEQWCRWCEDLKTVNTSLNLTTGPNQAGMVKHLLAGKALDTFSAYMASSGVTETLDHVCKGLKSVAATMFPDTAVSSQQQYLRHGLKKKS